MLSKASLSLKINTMIENGRKEITTRKHLEKYPIGSLVSYLNVDDIFRPGGFITKYKTEYFIYVLPDFKTKYKARYTHIQKMWVGSVYECRNDIVSIVASQKSKTKFPVIFKEIPLYYASDSYDAKRFTHTEKYKKIIKCCEYFEI
jgi:hypothetical protein